jgi:hypothetical protein
MGWEFQQRNARVLIADTRQHTFELDTAQYGMLLAVDGDRQCGMDGNDWQVPTEQLLKTHLSGSSTGGRRLRGTLE